MKRFISLILALCLVLGSVPNVLAADGYVLLTVGDKVFTSETTIDQVRKMYGQEKLKTISIFGGYAYTFYADNYSDYVYLETNAEGKIASYCTFGDNFTSTAGNSGAENSNTFSYLSGDAVSDPFGDNLIWAVTGYYSRNIDDLNSCIERYSSDAKYAIAILEHTVLMWKAISLYRTGKVSDVSFDETTFYINRQLMEGDSNLYDYCNVTGKSGEFNLMQISHYNYLMNYRAYLPNPLMYAQHGGDWDVPQNASLVFDYCFDSDTLIMGSLNSTFYSEEVYVPYTDYEKELLENASRIYQESVQTYNGVDSYFLTEPQDEVLPLEPGQIHPDAIKGAVGYLNAIRAAADLPLLEYSAELSEGCQYKAVLTTYLSQNGISNPSPHTPPRVEGISDEYYEKAQLGAGENLYYGNILTSIRNALDDSAGDPVTCGHRYNLLEPTYQYIGLGSSGAGTFSQSAHKFSGYQKYEGEIVAWPSKGVMLIQADGQSDTMYTVCFYRNYETTENTGIIFKCLNTGDCVEIPTGTENTSAEELHVSGSMVSYYSDEISMAQGRVYEITVTNVKSKQTGEIMDYTYRSVCESAYTVLAQEPEKIEIDQTSITVEPGSYKKLFAQILPEDAENRMVHWKSDNERVASVNANGYVTGIAEGTATITAYTDNGIEAKCTVTVKKQTLPTNPTSQTFTDVPAGEYYAQSVQWAVDNGITTGTDKNLFSPNDTCTRAQVVTFLWRAAGEPEPASTSNPFKDVSSTAYYAKAVRWAVENQITNGTSSDTFSPDAPCTRGQVATFLWRAQGKPAVSSSQNPFSDIAAGQYYYNAILWAVENGVTNGVGGNKFAPNDPCTRAQIVTFLYRALA